jgi:replicative DNA helicase
VRRKALKQIGRGIGVDLVVIDYLGLMQHPKADRHDLAVGATSRALKLFAGEARCQVMALAQLNRALDKDTQKRPALTNLRDSGSLEQDADAVIFLHREAYFDPKAEQEGPCEVIIAKHRNGAIGTVPLHFEPKRQRFLVPQADVPDWSIA